MHGLPSVWCSLLPLWDTNGRFKRAWGGTEHMCGGAQGWGAILGPSCRQPPTRFQNKHNSE